MQRGASWLSDRLQAAAGRTITYRRNQLTVSITGVSVLNEYEAVDDDGFRTTLQIHDWLFAPEDIVLRSETITPRPGDRITETLSGVTVVYEVTPIGDAPCVEWVDTSGIMIRVHTKRIT